MSNPVPPKSSRSPFTLIKFSRQVFILNVRTSWSRQEKITSSSGPSRCQFHKHFTWSFYECSYQKCKKKTDSLTLFFALLGFAHVKAFRKMLVKSTSGRRRPRIAKETWPLYTKNSEAKNRHLVRKWLFHIESICKENFVTYCVTDYF